MTSDLATVGRGGDVAAVSRSLATPAGRRFFEAGLLLAALAAVVAVPLYHGIGRSYVANGDMDLVAVYQAVLINSGLPVGFHEHTGYIYYIALSIWYLLGFRLGLLDALTLDDLARHPDFEAAWAGLTVSGRWFSVLLGVAFVFLVRRLAERIAGGRTAAAVAAFAVATGLALGKHTVMLRTELPAMVLVLTALVLLFGYLDRVGPRRFLWLALAAGAAGLALLVKLQTIAVLVWLPCFGVMFGAPAAASQPGEPPVRPWWWAAVGLGLLATVPALSDLVRLAGSGGFYQPLLAAWFTAGLVVCERRRGGGRFGIVAGLVALLAGVALAVAVTAYAPSEFARCAAVNFWDFMAPMVARDEGVPVPGRLEVIRQMLGAVPQILAGRLIPEPAITSEHLISYLFVASLLGGLVLAVRGQGGPAVRVLFLLVASLGIDTINGLRGVHYYSIFSDLWVVLGFVAAAAALVGQPGLCRPVLGIAAAVLLATSWGTARYQLIAPGLGWTRSIGSLCMARLYTPLIFHRFDRYCGPIEALAVPHPVCQQYLAPVRIPTGVGDGPG